MMLETLDAARDIGRPKEIAAVLVRHGLGDMVRRLGLANALARLPPPVQMRRALEELGPTFVKFGQILAGRADLLGPE